MKKFYEGSFKTNKVSIRYFVSHSQPYTNKWGKPVYILYLEKGFNMYNDDILIKYIFYNYKEFKIKFLELKNNLFL